MPCRVDEPVCCDESSDPGGPFCFIYATVFKNILLRLPFNSFKRALLTEINTAPVQLHLNSWAFVRGFSILCHHFGHLPSVDVFYTSLKPCDQVRSCGWVSTRLLGEFYWPSSSNHTKASRVYFSKSATTIMIPVFWTGSLCTGLRNPNSKNPYALKTYPSENERCVSSSLTSR